VWLVPNDRHHLRLALFPQPGDERLGRALRLECRHRRDVRAAVCVGYDFGRLHGAEQGAGAEQVDVGYHVSQSLCGALHLTAAFRGQGPHSVVVSREFLARLGDRVPDYEQLHAHLTQ
jgi:hypothetical protein